MRDEIIQKKMQKRVLKQWIQIILNRILCCEINGVFKSRRWLAAGAVLLGAVLAFGLHAGSHDEAWQTGTNNLLHSMDYAWTDIADAATNSMLLPPAYAQTPDTDAFVTTWNVAGKSFTPTYNYATVQFTIGVAPGGQVSIDWGDGGLPKTYNATGYVSNSYKNYQPDTLKNAVVTISGDLERFYFRYTNSVTTYDSPQLLLSIDQWGDIQWSSMKDMFRGAVHMRYEADDAPDLSAKPSVFSMFRHTPINADLSGWDVSEMTSLRYMFNNAYAFNGDISNWDVSKVTDMTYMFSGAHNFNADLSDWDVSKVRHMNQMFQQALSFNADISGWDVSSVEHMTAMFIGASAFNADISDWDVSSASIVYDMAYMFSGATSFNRNLGSWFITLEDKLVENRAVLVTDISSRVGFDTDIDGYDITGADGDDFTISGGQMLLNSASDYSSKSMYDITITANTTNVRNLGLSVEPSVSDRIMVTTTVTDTTNPRLASIERYSPASQNTTSQSLIYRATFSENVTGVDASDFILSPDSTWGGNTSASTGQFMQTRSPDLAIPDLTTVSDTVTVSDSETATSVSVAVDITHNYIGDLKIDLIAPDGTTKTLHNRTGSSTDNIIKTYAPDFGGVSIAGIWTLQIYDGFGVDPGVLNSWTLTVNYGNIVIITDVTDISGSDDVYYVTVSATQDGTYNLDLVSSGHGIADTAANPLTDTAPATGTDQTYTVSTAIIDNTAPTLASIQRYSPATSNTDSQTLVYEVIFSEDVTGVGTDDFVLSSDSTGSTTATDPATSISGSGSVYYAEVSASTDGTYNLDLVSSGHGIADESSNPLANTAPTGADETYTVSTTITDTTVPTVSSIERYNPSTATTDSQTLVYRITFSEDVTGVGTADFALSSSSTGGTGGGGTSEQFTQTRSPALAITQANTISDTITVSDSGTATSVSVAVDITHTYIGDLKIDLIAPDGTTKTVHSRSGGGADDIDQTYTPDFEGESIAGTWTLRINDDYAAYDDGVLNSWALTINYGTTTTTTVSPVTAISGSGDTYYVTVSSTVDGTYNLDLVSLGHNIVDAANNPLTNTSPTGADETYTVSTTVIDNTNPRLESLERYNPASQNTDSQSLVYKATFSKSVTGVTASDFVLSPGSTGGINGVNPVSGISGSGDTYYVTVSSTVDGTYNLDLVSSGHSIADTTGNSMINTAPTGADETYTVSTTVIDNTNPRLESLERYSPTSQNTTSQSLIYRATFSENVTGVDASDFILSPDSTWGGNTSASTGQFMQTRSPDLAIPDLTTVSDTVTVSDSETATSVSVAVDITHNYIGDLKIDLIAPDGTTKTLHNRTGSSTDNIIKTYAPDFGGVSIAGIWTLQIYDGFGVDPGVLNSWTLTVNYGNIVIITDVTDISGSDDVYYVTVSATQDGTYNLDLVSSGHGIADTAANPLTDTAPATGTDQTYTVSTAIIDNTAPTLASIQRYSPATSNTDSQTLVYEVIFSEDVTGVGTDDFVLSSDSTGSTTATDPATSISGSGSVYYAEVSASTDGTYNLDLVSSGHGIADESSNPLANTAPTGADETYTVSTTITDTTVPTVSSIERYNPSTATTDSQTLVYRITFSEDVTGVGTADFALSSSSTGGTGGGGTSEQFTQTRSPALAITQANTISDTITVSDSGTATSVSVAVDITHTYIGDLKIDLIAPDGTTKTVHSRSGGGADDIDQTYTPDFEGESIAGTWTLRINDDYAAYDDGVLNSWALTINYGTTTTTTVSPVTAISGSGDTYYVTVSSTVDGTYNLDLVSLGHNIVDAANNPLTNTSPTGADETYTVSTTVIDNTNPRLESLERYNPASQNTDSQSLSTRQPLARALRG